MLFLTGCQEASPKLDSDCNITLNITSPVNPDITSSRGEGSYDEATKTYNLTVATTAQVDISLSYPDFETVTVSFSQSELLEKTIIRDIEFGKEPTATVVFNINTDAKYDEIIIPNHDFSRNNRTFTIVLPSRDITETIQISKEGYQDINVEISPENLVVGYYYQELFLIKDEEVLITFQLNEELFYSFSLFNVETNEPYRSQTLNYRYFYVLNKNEEVYYFDPVISAYQYLKADTNQIINVATNSIDAENNFIIDNNDFPYINDLYYEYQGYRKQVTYSLNEDELYTNIPVGAQILYHYNNKLFYYSKNTSNLHVISLDVNDFNDGIPFEPNVRIFNTYNEQYLDEITYNDVTLSADNNFFKFTNTKYLNIDGYYLNQDNLLIQFQDENEEWITELTAIPAADGVILKFVDENNQPIEVDDLFINFSVRNLFINVNDSVTIGTRHIGFDYFDYIKKLNYIQIDGKYYYSSNNPIKISTDIYPFAIYQETTNPDSFFHLQLGDGSVPDYYSNGDIRIYNFKVGDMIQITTKKLNQVYIYPMTKDVLERGIMKIDDIGMELPLDSFKVSFQNSIDKKLVSIQLFDCNYSHIVYNNTKTEATVYYLVEPISINVLFSIYDKTVDMNYTYDNLSPDIVVE